MRGPWGGARPSTFVVRARLAGALALLLASVAQAHTQSASYGAIVVDRDRLTYAIRIPEAELNAVVPLDTNGDGTVTAAEVTALSARIFDHLQNALSLRVEGGGPLERTDARIEPPPASVACWPQVTDEDRTLVRVTLVYRIPGGARAVVLRSSLPATELTPDHNHLVKISQGGAFRQLVPDEAPPAILEEGQEFRFELKDPTTGAAPTPTGQGPARGNPFLRFLRLGLFHIWTGYDHLLFLAALIVVAPGLLDLLKIATAFTVSHSMALALAVSGLLSVSGSVVEPAIALTIVYVALENCRPVKTSRRWKVAFLLGLVHGLAFADALHELELTRAALAGCVLSFNLGVEVGQVVVLAALFPLLAWGRRRGSEASFRSFVRVSSCGIAGMGLFWFVQRAFL